MPAGVREIEGRWYWQPTSKRERKERKAKGLKASVPLGAAGTVEARTRWAELTGKRDPAVQGTVGELLTIWERDAMKKRPNGKARADSTVYQYSTAIPILREKFGTSRYGKTEFEASRGQAIGTAEIQRFINKSGSQGKRFLAVLDNAFDHAIREEGLTTYNPCDKVIPPAQDARTREPKDWEVECLGVLATPVLNLILVFKGIHGWRISKVIGLQRKQLFAEGIRVQPAKGAQRELWEWSAESRRIIADAEQLPKATRFPASPVFPNIRGKAYSYAGFNTAWQTLKAQTNAGLAGGIFDPDTLQLHPALSIDDLHVHDLRSKVHDDAEDQGREGHEVLGNTEQVADKFYARREKKRRPLR